jgi:serine/threonine-protein kinase
LWSETFDRHMQDVFAIQEEISSAIVKTLTNKLAPVPPLKCDSRNLVAYNLYLKGRFHWHKRTSVGLNRSVQYFSEAIAEDPTFAMAYSGLADSYTLMADYAVLHPSEAMPQAKVAARRALELDPMLGEAEASLGLIRGLHDWEWAEAEQHYRRSIEFNPGYSTSHHWYAVDHLVILKRMDEAREQLEIARGLDPLSPIIREAIGFLAMLERRYDEAIVHYREELELDPYFYKGYTSMGRAFIQLGKYEKAISHLEKGRALAGDVPNILGALGQAWALSGNHEKGREFLAALGQLSKSRYVPCAGFALIHLGLGEKEKALEFLEMGCEQRHLMLATLNIHPAYDDLRGTPRFDAILRRMGLLPG